MAKDTLKQFRDATGHLLAEIDSLKRVVLDELSSEESSEERRGKLLVLTRSRLGAPDTMIRSVPFTVPGLYRRCASLPLSPGPYTVQPTSPAPVQVARDV